MKQRFRMYQRGVSGRYYLEDNVTGKQESLGTSDRTEAERLLHARNEADRQPALNTQLARAYLMGGDPQVGRRTWQDVMEALRQAKHATAERTSERYDSAFREAAFDPLRRQVVMETRPEALLRVLQGGTISTNVFLRRLHSFALGMGWLPWPILAFKQWPRLRFQPRRAITRAEAERILAAERNPEWRAFLELLWHIGAAQADLAALTAEDVDWPGRTLSYHRQKTGTLASQRFGGSVEALLRERPGEGLLFPHFAKLSSADRATRFARRCQQLGIAGVSLHSYRYAWAERAREAGYPERFAQEALGHSSAAVHRAYAKGARVVFPSLEEFEQRSEPPLLMAV